MHRKINGPYLSLQDFASKLDARCDLIVEGGFGENPYLFHRIREGGFGGHYVIINSEKPQTEIPPRVSLYVDDCLDLGLANSIVKQFNSKSPLFATNLFLDYLYDDRIESKKNIASILTESPYKMQLHRGPSSFRTVVHKNDITAGKQVSLTDTICLSTKDSSTSDENFLIDFVQSSIQKGWRVELPCLNVLFLSRV